LIPHAVANLVPRPALWAWLDAAHATTLILVCAPGGYGKTTTIASWLLHRRDRPDWANTLITWCSLDSLDNDLHRFASRLVTAVHAVSAGACDQTMHMLEGRLEVKAEYLARQFVEDVALLPGRLLLVLDDFHHISDPAVHAFVEQVVHQALMREPVHPLSLVIITRNSLPFSVARLRSQRRLVELRMQDLQMNSAESEQLLSGLLDTSLTPAAVALLQRYVEGWAAGISLLALSLRNQPDIERWLVAIDKKPDQYIANYFMDEVLASQPAAVRTFLRATSLLPALDSSLCAAALGEDNEEHSQALLDHVVHNNLFVVPIDGVHGSYRYHDLFKSMLQDRLRRSTSSDAIDQIYCRVAKRYAEQGILDRAIEGYLAGHAPEQAAALLEAHIPVLQDREEWQLLHRFLHRLPDDLVAHHPALLLADGWVYDYYIQTARLRTLVVQVRELLATLQPHMEPRRWLRLHSELDLLAIAPMLTVSSIEETRRCTEAALTYLPPDDLFLRSKILLFLARQYQRNGRINDALDRLDEETRSTAAQSLTYMTRLLFARHLVLIHEGRMAAAEYTVDLYLRLAQQTGLPLTIGNAHLSAASVYYATGHDELALVHCRAALAQPYHSNHTIREITALYMIELCAQAGDATAAVQVAESFASLATSLGDVETIAVAQMLEAAAMIFTGRAQAAQGWLDALQIDRVPAIHPFAGWVWGCGLLALGTPEALARASAGLAPLAERCRAIYFLAWAVKLLVLLARVYAAQGELARGTAALCAAVRLIDAPGYQRSLLDQDPALDRLLAQALQDRHLDLHVTLQHLQNIRRERSIAGVKEPLPQRPLRTSPYAVPAMLPLEPLTDRELEILRLLDARLSSKEISRQLNISVHTVRNHTVRIYEKLAVGGWLAATQRARSLGLLPQ
jgi:LuxR family transcriptional regulator, maltose regulon positive regulatory protein